MAGIWGRIYLDQWRGEPQPHVYHRDDGNRDTADSAASYFRAPRGNADREVLGTLTGRILDLGCGPGSYTLFLEQRGLEVVAIDASPGAIDVCRERGCGDARVIAIDEVDATLGRFDAIVCMGNTFGIDANPGTLPDRLDRMRSVLAPNGRLVLALLDPLATSDPNHLRYHERNRAAGRPAGLTRARLEYRGEMSDWWHLWLLTESELRDVVAQANWQVANIIPDGASKLWELRPGA
jgi:SAM-dependent methyltransferase